MQLRRPGAKAGDQAAVVTSAPMSVEDELRARTRRYAIMMLIRTACFVLAVALPIPLIWKAPAVLVAIVLPWMAVTVANTGGKREAGVAVGYEARVHEEKPPAPIEGHKIIDG